MVEVAGPERRPPVERDRRRGMLAVERFAGRPPQRERRADVGRGQPADLGVEASRSRRRQSASSRVSRGRRPRRSSHRRSAAARKTITPPMTIRTIGQMLPQLDVGHRRARASCRGSTRSRSPGTPARRRSRRRCRAALPRRAATRSAAAAATPAAGSDVGGGGSWARSSAEHRRRVRSIAAAGLEWIAAETRRRADPRHGQGGARVTDQAEIGVFGGSGFYSLLDDVREIKVDTPYGPPSDSFFLADGRRPLVAFLPRHGRRHTIPPHLINYRANVWAMRSLGVQGGHLAVRGRLAPAPRQARRLRPVRPVRRPDPRPRTTRSSTGPIVTHISSADIYDPELRRIAARRLPRARHRGPRARHDRDHQRPAVLDEGRVEVVQRRRLGGHLDDPVPGGVPLPRAGDGGREHRPDHRLRRGRPRGHRGGRRPVGHRGLRPERGADPAGRARHDRAVPGRPRRAGRAGPRSSSAAATAT